MVRISPITGGWWDGVVHTTVLNMKPNIKVNAFVDSIKFQCVVTSHGVVNSD